MAEVHLRNVTKKFDDTIAVKNFSFKIKDGEFLILLGPSGCGKTTILRCIAGLEKVTEGEIYIGKRMVNKVSPKDRDIAMVFQNYALYPHMSVYKNTAFGLKLHKIPKKEIAERVENTADLLGIRELLKRKPKALSGGQRQRVALGRAIVRNPKVFLFDEPLSNLDAKLRISMRAELLDLHHRLNTTTIYVTHDQLEAMTMGDRIVVMKDGVIEQIGIPQEVYNNPINIYVASFIGSPSMNFIPCKIIKKKSNYYAKDNNGAVTLLIPPDKNEKVSNYLEKPVTLGFRPEHLISKEMMRNCDPQTVLKTSVGVTELVGSEILAHLKIGKYSVIARLDPSFILKRGDTLDLVLNMNKSHLFDKDTGETIF